MELRGRVELPYSPYRGLRISRYLIGANWSANRVFGIRFERILPANRRACCQVTLTSNGCLRILRITRKQPADFLFVSPLLDQSKHGTPREGERTSCRWTSGDSNPAAVLDAIEVTTPSSPEAHGGGCGTRIRLLSSLRTRWPLLAAPTPSLLISSLFQTRYAT